MPEGNGSGGDSRSGEGDSSPALWRMVKALFRGSDHDQSLRAQIEEAIEEHEGELGTSPDTSGDLVPLERQMLRNLLSNALKYTSAGKVLLGCRRHGERLRIEVARRRVQSSSEAIERVAETTGFRDPERMRRAFIRAFGQPPQSLRRAARAG